VEGHLISFTKVLFQKGFLLHMGIKTGFRQMPMQLADVIFLIQPTVYVLEMVLRIEISKWASK